MSDTNGGWAVSDTAAMSQFVFVMIQFMFAVTQFVFAREAVTADEAASDTSGGETMSGMDGG
ncbi:MAG: hypothetical protein LBK25_05830 [Treponema sp.]|nr:hypothetical protein [Treponema sp.]